LVIALNSCVESPGPVFDRVLKSALNFLLRSPAIYHGERKRAIQYVKSALAELSNGDPDELRAIT